MFKHILIPTDGSEFSAKVVTDGIALARTLGAHVTAVHVAPSPEHSPFDLEMSAMRDERMELAVSEAFLAAGEVHLNRIAEAAAAAGVPHEQVLRRGAEPWKGIIETANDKGCDLIVMAAHGRRGLSALLVGSETNKVLTHSRIPVLVYR